MGFHCSDCVFGSFTYHEDIEKYQGACSRGYTLTDPHVRTMPENRFSEGADAFVPTIDPFGREYLRISNVCEHFLRPQDAARMSSRGR